MFKLGLKNIIAYGVLLVVLFLIGFFIARNSVDEIKSVKRTQILLGTVVDVQVRDTDEKKADNAMDKAFTEVKRIDDQFTTYNEESPVWKLNKAADSLIIIDQEIYNLIVLCDSIARLSGGSFDASLDNLICAWGFNTDNPHLPRKTAIDSALLRSGWENIIMIGRNSIRRKEGVGLNFGAIAKGYAVDRAVEVLKQAGINEALVNAGGEIRAIGNDWAVGIQHPREQNQLIAKIKLNGMTVATSGDYENYFENDGVRYHHILNPKTGHSSRGLQSVTIIHRENAFADGLTTAVFVMGKEKGMSLVEKISDTEAMIIDDEGKIFYTSGFEKFLIE